MAPGSLLNHKKFINRIFVHEAFSRGRLPKLYRASAVPYELSYVTDSEFLLQIRCLLYAMYLQCFLLVKSELFLKCVTETLLEGMRLICYGLEYFQLVAVARLTDFKPNSSVITQQFDSSRAISQRYKSILVFSVNSSAYTTKHNEIIYFFKKENFQVCSVATYLIIVIYSCTVNSNKAA
jgi:hypothetical protein